MSQKIVIMQDNVYSDIERWIDKNGIRRVLIVHGNSFYQYNYLNNYLGELENKGIQIFHFTDYKSNPKYESIINGTKYFIETQSEGIIAIGGGSTIDVSKLIKAYSPLQQDIDFMKQKIKQSNIPFLVIPTTAGSGSEATKFAVVYRKNEKKSVEHECLIPDFVLYNPKLLRTLPLYQKKCTMMDTFWHAIESFWSINSTDESKKYSKLAIRGVMDNVDLYLCENENSYKEMFLASYYGGCAINLTKTTAGHAMSYKLTTLLEIPHGHSVALCNRSLLYWMINNIDKCVDVRGKEYLKSVFIEIANMLGCEDYSELPEFVNRFTAKLGLGVPKATDNQIKEMAKTVNLERLNNNPIKLGENDIETIYQELFEK